MLVVGVHLWVPYLVVTTHKTQCDTNKRKFIGKLPLRHIEGGHHKKPKTPIRDMLLWEPCHIDTHVVGSHTLACWWWLVGRLILVVTMHIIHTNKRNVWGKLPLRHSRANKKPKEYHKRHAVLVRLPQLYR